MATVAPAAGVVVAVAATGDASPPDTTWVVPREVPFAVAATTSAVEVMVTGNRDNWSQAMVEVLVPGVAAPFLVTVSVQV